MYLVCKSNYNKKWFSFQLFYHSFPKEKKGSLSYEKNKYSVGRNDSEWVSATFAFWVWGVSIPYIVFDEKKGSSSFEEIKDFVRWIDSGWVPPLLNAACVPSNDGNTESSFKILCFCSIFRGFLNIHKKKRGGKRWKHDNQRGEASLVRFLLTSSTIKGDSLISNNIFFLFFGPKKKKKIPKNFFKKNYAENRTFIEN